MKIIEVKLFEFKELSEASKAKVLEDHRDINTSHDWYEGVYENFKEKALAKGFVVEKIYFSGFYSQGDGAMFEGYLDTTVYKPEGLHRLVQRCINEQAITYSWRVSHRGHYYHSHCSHISFETDNYPGVYVAGVGYTGRIHDEFSKLEDQIAENYHDLCHELYRDLEKEYEFLSSDEEVISTIEANEYTFEENGKMRNY